MKAVLSALVLCILVSAAAPCRAAELWLSSGIGGGLSADGFSKVSDWNLDASLGLVGRGLFGGPWEAGFALGYAGFLPADAWVDSLRGAQASLSLGYRVPLSARLSLVPRAAAGTQLLFARTARTRLAYETGGFESRQAAQALAQAGLGAELALGSSFSLGLELDYRLLAERGGAYHGPLLFLGLSYGLGRGAREPESAPSRPALAESARTGETYSAALEPLRGIANLRIKTEGKRVLIVIEDSFASYKAELSPRTVEQLGRVGRALAGLPVRTLAIRGYVAEDQNQDEALDLSLSLARAQAVRDWLLSNGYLGATAAVSTEGLGKNEPIADNASAEGRARNRRVELQMELQ